MGGRDGGETTGNVPKSSLRKEGSLRHIFSVRWLELGRMGHTPLPGCVGGEYVTEQVTPSNPIWTR